MQTLEEKIPAGHPPSESDEPAYTQWREELQRALVETFCDLNEAFACKGLLAGATITVMIQVPFFAPNDGNISVSHAYTRIARSPVAIGPRKISHSVSHGGIKWHWHSNFPTVRAFKAVFAFS